MAGPAAQVQRTLPPPGKNPRKQSAGSHSFRVNEWGSPIPTLGDDFHE